MSNGDYRKFVSLKHHVFVYIIKNNKKFIFCNFIFSRCYLVCIIVCIVLFISIYYLVFWTIFEVSQKINNYFIAVKKRK